MKTQIYLVRHGQPVLQNALLGSTDTPLTELGWQQLQTSFQALPAADLIISSPLLRCASFAQYYATNNNVALQILDVWRECHFGDWDGKDYLELQAQHSSLFNLFLDDPQQHTPPKGESLTDFCERVIQSFQQLVSQHRSKKIILLTHAGVIRTLVAHCLSIDYLKGKQFKNFSLDYAKITSLSVFHHRDFADVIQLNTLNYSPEGLSFGDVE